MSLKYMERGFGRTTQRAWNVSLGVETYCRPKSDAHLRHLRGERWAGPLLMDDANERWLYHLRGERWAGQLLMDDANEMKDGCTRPSVLWEFVRAMDA